MPTQWRVVMDYIVSYIVFALGVAVAVAFYHMGWKKGESDTNRAWGRHTGMESREISALDIIDILAPRCILDRAVRRLVHDRKGKLREQLQDAVLQNVSWTDLLDIVQRHEEQSGPVEPFLSWEDVLQVHRDWGTSPFGWTRRSAYYRCWDGRGKPLSNDQNENYLRSSAFICG
jgi:hypothetical protein